MLSPLWLIIKVLVSFPRVFRILRNSLSSGLNFDQSKILRTYMGEKTTGEMLDLALGHSGHHLKQLYELNQLENQ